MPTEYKNVNNLKVAEDLLSFVNDELLKGIDISPEKFWSGLDEITHDSKLDPNSITVEMILDKIKKFI